MTAAVFSSTAVPVTTPPMAAPGPAASKNETAAILRPFILIGAVAFVIGFVGYLALAAPHAVVLEAREAPPAAVSTPAATPTLDLGNPPRPV